MTICSDLDAAALERTRGDVEVTWRGRWAVGIDPGRWTDPCGLVLSQRVEWRTRDLSRDDVFRRAGVEYRVRASYALPLTTTFDQQLEAIERVLASAALAETGGVVAVVDETGMGQPQVERLRRRVGPARVVGITLSGGREPGRSSSGGHTVPKGLLVSTLDGLLASGELQLAASMREAGELLAELRSFQIQSTPSGGVTFNARAGAHDDRLLAMMLSLWWLHTQAGVGPSLVKLRGI